MAESIRGVVYGHSSGKILKFKESLSKTQSEYRIPTTYDTEKILEFNAMIPIYCLKIVLKERDLDLVFQTFREIVELVRNYFLPLKKVRWEKSKVKISVPSLGKLYWIKFKYVLKWKLGSSGSVSQVLLKKNLSFCRLINLSKNRIQN